ncbi:MULTISPECIES: hypothetical protein [unclassified Arthrobacter]|uniref:hypothetical protein n=1 Tax=unclassified Arthrobacter TaxID=235627 RepID=UPI00159E8673|nr:MULTISPECIES: hypothetical protein [unclassified Arthrobacter]MCQ9163011.1 hypothetical protein [Arthrobacter sp. STN4]NVM97467.1 hypothetical protein [Arthrobacter sp. SDTb3-6]
MYAPYFAISAAEGEDPGVEAGLGVGLALGDGWGVAGAVATEAGSVPGAVAVGDAVEEAAGTGSDGAAVAGNVPIVMATETAISPVPATLAAPSNSARVEKRASRFLGENMESSPVRWVNKLWPEDGEAQACA